MTKDKIYIIGNWKSNKNRQEVKDWFAFIATQDFSKAMPENLTIVVCPPFTYLSLSRVLIAEGKLTLNLGGQDVSPFKEGAYTGEVSASMIKEYADFCIIGHSERRKNFAENDDLLAEKVKRAKETGLKIIFCVQDENTFVPPGVDIIAYEPIWAIGSGKPDTPENANKVIGAIKQRHQAKVVIYGGSVSPDNILSFVSMEHIDGVLPGGASLDPVKFAQMISQCKK
ncbi:triosephosphate isomerase [Candidatus Gottesmanbacteria bacterium]|nr:triosephosphate isomerase [Candidatus Gottesmanbacteria bacterium]